jgi:FkbM family methyltransferase
MISNLNKTVIDGVTIHYLPDDVWIGQSIANGTYEPYETKLILNEINEDSVVIDVGANIGYYSLLIANKIKPGSGHVTSFEPDKTNFSILKKNISSNKISKKHITISMEAVGYKREDKYLYLSKTNRGDHRVYNDGDREKIEVQYTTLDYEFKNIYKVDLIKIDTQGAEPFVILGARKTILKHKPVIFFEYWPSAYIQAEADHKEMINWLGEYGTFEQIDENQGKCISITKENILKFNHPCDYINLIWRPNK